MSGFLIVARLSGLVDAAPVLPSGKSRLSRPYTGSSSRVRLVLIVRILQGCLPCHARSGHQRRSRHDPAFPGSSSSSSSSEDRREFRELVRGANEAHQRYFDATREVSQLERCLDDVWWPSRRWRGRPLPRRWWPPTPRPTSWVRMLLCLVVSLVICHS